MAVGGGLCVYQELGDRVRLGHQLSPTLHPEVGAGVAAAHGEGKAGFPGRCQLGARPSAWLRGETGWLHLFLPGGTFSSLFPQILEGCFCCGLWWPHPRIVRREHIRGPGHVKYVQDPSPWVGGEAGAGTRHPGGSAGPGISHPC